LHLDYVRYPNDLFDYSTRAIAEFRGTRAPLMTPADRLRLDAAAAKNPAAWADALPAAWTAFRRDRLTGLVRKLQAAARAARPGVMVSAAVVPDVDRARDRYLQDWSGWASAGLVDAICPMAYTPDLAAFSETVALVRGAADRVPVWAGIGAWRLPVGRTIEHVRAARSAGAAGVLLFSYDALAEDKAAPLAYFAGLRAIMTSKDSDID
jgi:uncharacterized lipoprotein YddW (UPF0748 family)